MINILYLFFPLALFSILEIYSKKSLIRKWIYFLTSFLFIFFIGFAYKLGVDWVEYTKVYSGISSQISSYEIGYVYLNRIFFYSNISFWFFSISIKLIYSLTIILFFYKFSKNPTLSLTIFLGIMFPFFNDPIRQLIPSIFLFLSFIVMKRNLHLLGILMGSLFHSSFFILFVSFLSTIKKRTILLLLFFCSFTLIVILNELISLPYFGVSFLDKIINKIEFYISYSEYANLYSTFIRIIFLMYVCFSRRIYTINESFLGVKLSRIFWLFSVVYLSLEIAFITLPILPQRMRFYFIPFVIILFSNSLSLSRLKSLLLIFLLLSYLFISLYLFTEKPIGYFYQLEFNYIINLFIDNTSHLELLVNDYWNDPLR